MAKTTNERLQKMMLDTVLTELEINDRKHGPNAGVQKGLDSAERYKKALEKQKQATMKDRKL